jgi:iron complex outermembrane recepter protein
MHVTHNTIGGLRLSNSLRWARGAARQLCRVWALWTVIAVATPPVAASVFASLCFVSFCMAQPSSDSQTDTPGELPAPVDGAKEVLDMDLDQLSQAEVLVPSMDTVVSSVSRQESTVGRSPAAVYVITPEMIRRSGATNIPDLLRMVPGVEVAQIDVNKWAITIRGFNDRFAGKLLVQIDGRAVYRQATSGVFWDEQDVVLQDVERIEVVRGPGATVWGANAVNGVINIITKNAKDTQGALVYGGGGTEERGFSTVRYGGKWNDDTYYRVYGKQFERDSGFNPDGEHDDWRQARTGFRLDSTPSCDDAFTFQGDFFEGDSGVFDVGVFPTPPYSRDLIFDTHLFGQNLLTRWTHQIDEDSDWALQGYWDHVNRRTAALDDEQTTYDLDFQYHFLWREDHNIIAGCGYRHINDHLLGDFGLSADPPVRNANLVSCFVQDEITLEEDRWYLTGGSKFEQNDFTGFEYQPSVRLLFLPSDRESVWGAVSRAVRTPGQIEQDAVIRGSVSPVVPVFTELTGDRSVVAEELLAFELGYRAQPVDDFSWDLATFYNIYENLIGVAPSGAPFFDPSLGAVIIPLEFGNDLSANTYGAELASTYRINPRWELTGSYTLLFLDVQGLGGNEIQGSSPTNQLYVRSSWDLREDLEFDLIGRYVDSLPALGVPSYVVMDARLAWRPNKNLEWAVVGRNMFDSPHQEFADERAGMIGTEVESSVYTSLTWTF